jgi:hypothetical protein
MPTKLELHHVGSKSNSPLSCTLCVRCHISLSNRQLIWDSRWTYSNNSDDLRDSFVANGIYELLIQKYYETDITDFREMAAALPPLIRNYRERC